MKDLPLDTTDLTWLAGLARALLGDAHAADDLVQETVVAALQSPVPSDAPRRAWLGSVARRLAARRFRGEIRRERRERRAARVESLPDSTELLEKAEVAEQVAAAIRSLPEPYRHAVLLRFLEGLTPEEIAREGGKSADTVRWRIRRGIELVRQQLVKDHDRDWSSWCVLLLPLAQSRGDVGLAATGALGVFTGSAASWFVMKLMILSVAALCGVGLWLVLGPSPDVVDETVVAQDESRELPPISPALEEPSRMSVDGSESEVAKSEEPTRTVETWRGLAGDVVDEEAKPVADATVYLIPSSSDLTSTGRDLEPLVGRVETDRKGRFQISENAWQGLSAVDVASLDLSVAANGFLRRVVPDVFLNGPLEERRTVVLDRGGRLMGRVVDEFGRGVPNIELLAYTSNSPWIDHVSPSQVLRRSERAELDASSPFERCEARTDHLGDVVFSGLPLESVTVRSLDPGWTIEKPAGVQPNGPFVYWTASRKLGVRLFVVDPDTGAPVRGAAAVFRAELTFEDGSGDDYGQWVGRGDGVVSFLLDPKLWGQEEQSPFITEATFYGTVRSGTNEVAWRAETVEDRDGVYGVVDVRVELDASEETRQEESGVAEKKEDEPPSGTLRLDVRYKDGGVFDGELTLDWIGKDNAGRAWEGDKRPARLGPGIFEITLRAGDLQLWAANRTSSGSLAPWEGRVLCAPDATTMVNVVLPRGAAVEIRRPFHWSGEWFVHASWRLGSTESWQGSWNYSTIDPTLTLSALRSAEWRFQLRPDSSNDTDPIVRTIVLTEGNLGQVAQ